MTDKELSFPRILLVTGGSKGIGRAGSIYENFY